MQTGGAVARENKLIEELSAPCGLVARPAAAESMIRLNMLSFSSKLQQEDVLCVERWQNPRTLREEF